MTGIEESLSSQAGKSAVLLGFRKIWGGLLSLVVMAYLARILDVSNFGLVAIATTLVGFVQAVSSGGIGEFIIYYNKEDKEDIQQAAFWMHLSIVFLVFFLFAISSGIWEMLYQESRLSNIIWLLLFSSLFSIFQVVPMALMQKAMEFPKIVPIQMMIGTLSQVSMVIFAWLGMELYSLVLPVLIFPPLLSLALFFRSGFRPKLNKIGAKHWPRIFKYSRQILSSNIITKIANEGDTLVVGKILGLEALGIYDIAFRFSNLLNQHLLPIVRSICMPVFARNQHHLSTVRTQYLKMLSTLSFLGIPIIAGIGLFALDLINLLYGDKWASAILPVQLFCVFAAIRFLGSPTSGLYFALGRPGMGLNYNLVFTPILFLSIYLAAPWGLLGVCLIVTIMRSIGTSAHFVMANALLDYGWQSFWKAIRAPICTTVFAVIAFSVIPWEPRLWMAPIFGLTILITLFAFFKHDLKQQFQIFSSLSPKFQRFLPSTVTR
ncbi:MAG: oligosaccharide flippase family protein [Saprospiraceae bacterium]